MTLEVLHCCVVAVLCCCNTVTVLCCCSVVLLQYCYSVVLLQRHVTRFIALEWFNNVVMSVK